MCSCKKLLGSPQEVLDFWEYFFNLRETTEGGRSLLSDSRKKKNLPLLWCQRKRRSVESWVDWPLKVVSDVSFARKPKARRPASPKLVDQLATPWWQWSKLVIGVTPRVNRGINIVKVQWNKEFYIKVHQYTMYNIKGKSLTWTCRTDSIILRPPPKRKCFIAFFLFVWSESVCGCWTHMCSYCHVRCLRNKWATKAAARGSLVIGWIGKTPQENRRHHRYSRINGIRD